MVKKLKRKKAAAEPEAEVEAEAAEAEAPRKKVKRKAVEEAPEVVETQPVGKKKKRRLLKMAEAAAAEVEEREEAEEAVVKKEKKKKKAAAEDGDGEQKEKKEKMAGFKVCVVGLPWSADEAMLRKDFEECGEVGTLALLTTEFRGEVKSRGIAFISFATEEGRTAALKYNGTEYGGRTLKVTPAYEREERKEDATGRDNKGKGKGKDDKGKGKGKGKGKDKGKPRAPLGEKPEHCTSILVKSLAEDVVEDDLYTFFAKCGAAGPTNIRIITSGATKKLAFVDFDDTDAVDQAIKLRETDLKGNSAFLDYSKPREHKIAKKKEAW